jgi:hypothetical protein
LVLLFSGVSVLEEMPEVVFGSTNTRARRGLREEAISMERRRMMIRGFLCLLAAMAVSWPLVLLRMMETGLTVAMFEFMNGVLEHGRREEATSTERRLAINQGALWLLAATVTSWPSVLLRMTEQMGLTVAMFEFMNGVLEHGHRKEVISTERRLMMLSGGLCLLAATVASLPLVLIIMMILITMLDKCVSINGTVQHPTGGFLMVPLSMERLRLISRDSLFLSAATVVSWLLVLMVTTEQLGVIPATYGSMKRMARRGIREEVTLTERRRTISRDTLFL